MPGGGGGEDYYYYYYYYYYCQTGLTIDIYIYFV
jgi:hypothetical protein